MAVTPIRKSNLIAARELPRVVDAAVKAASARVAGAEAASGVIVKWELIGRVAKNLAQAQELATGITSEVSKSAGVKVQPAVLSVGKQIVCGFFEPGNVPVVRNL